MDHLFRTVVINDDVRFAELERPWSELHSQCGYQVLALTFEWLSTAWKFFRKFEPSARLHIVCVYERDQLIAILPFMLSKIPFKRFLKINQLSFLCFEFSDYGGFIIRKNYDEKVITFLFNEYLTHWSDWDTILLKNLSEENPQFRMITSVMKPKKWKMELKQKTKYYFINCQTDSFENYFSSLDGKFRHNLKTRHNKLERYLQENKCDVTVNPSEPYDLHKLKELHELYVKRQSRVRGRTMMEDEAFQYFMFDFCVKYPEHVALFVVRVGHELFAFSFNLVYQNTIMHWNPSFSETFKAFAPGQLLLEYMIRDCFDKKCTMDFLRGDSEYKSKWTPNYFPGYQIRMTNPKKWIMLLKGT